MKPVAMLMMTKIAPRRADAAGGVQLDPPWAGVGTVVVDNHWALLEVDVSSHPAMACIWLPV